MIGKFIKEDGIKYCKEHECKSCKLKSKVCINESGELVVAPHIDFEKFATYFNEMSTEIVMNNVMTQFHGEVSKSHKRAKDYEYNGE